MVEKMWRFMDSIELVCSMVSIGLSPDYETATSSTNFNPCIYRDTFVDYYMVH